MAVAAFFPSCDKKGSHGPCKVDHEFRVARFGFHRSAALSMGVADTIADCRNVVDDGLAISKNCLENPFLMLVGSQV